MGLWGARQDLEFIYRFRNSTIEFLNAHNAMVQQAQQQQESAYHSFRPHQDQIQLPAEEYSTLREQYVRGITAVQISSDDTLLDWLSP